MFIKHRADIDGLRAIAVISVLLYHLQNSFLPGGFIGVDIFFVISGFVVTSSLSQHQSPSFWNFIARFYTRRLARIMPALLIMLLAIILADSLLIPQAWLSQLSQETAPWCSTITACATLHRFVNRYRQKPPNCRSIMAGCMA